MPLTTLECNAPSRREADGKFFPLFVHRRCGDGRASAWTINTLSTNGWAARRVRAPYRQLPQWRNSLSYKTIVVDSTTTT
eukprot:scaffold70906_cov29-Phaeocystis_antarctica.AAC.1